MSEIRTFCGRHRAQANGMIRTWFGIWMEGEFWQMPCEQIMTKIINLILDNKFFELMQIKKNRILENNKKLNK
jgi:hypothetical protein